MQQEHGQIGCIWFFCYNILECVAGKQEWKLEKVRKTVSTSCVTVSDEAFALLILENGWERFVFYASNEEKNEVQKLPPNLYTGRKGGNMIYEGWSDDGIERFNELCSQVKSDRMSSEGQTFEKSFLNICCGKAKQRKQTINAMDNDDSQVDTDNNDQTSRKRKSAFNELSIMANENKWV